nr:HD domain-containing protein [uncultured Mogibacterium sp.]
MNEIDKTIIEKLASRVAELGGRAYMVGGAVRDEIMKRPIKDVDIEVHGISGAILETVLKELGKPLRFGSAFGVYSLAGHQMDIALPRSERKAGNGHRDFEIEIDPFIGIKEAARRRDFTMNALLKDILSGEIADPYGGTEDIKNRIIRHIDDRKFGEDPLRALRAAQFRSRFGFQVAPSTISICRALDLRNLSAERVEMEMKKALLESRRPSEFFECLREMGQLGYWFKELEQLIGLEQNPEFHPEGDVWTHTMMVLDRAAQFRPYASDPYAFMLLALTHDFGKITTTEFVNGAIHAYGHEIQGAEIAERFLDRVCHGSDIKKYIANMIPNHMRPNKIAESRSAVKKTNHLFDSVLAPSDLIYFAICDKPKLPYVLQSQDKDSIKVEMDKGIEKDLYTTTENEREQERIDFLFDRLEVYREMMAKPYVTGKDLIINGVTPGEDFGTILEYAHKLRLAGIPKDNALRQTISYAIKLRKNNKR